MQKNDKKPLTKEKNGITIGTTFQKSKDVEEKSSWQNTFQRVSDWWEGNRNMLMKMVLESYGRASGVRS